MQKDIMGLAFHWRYPSKGLQVTLSRLGVIFQICYATAYVRNSRYHRVSGLPAVVRGFIRDGHIMRMAFSDTT